MIFIPHKPTPSRGVSVTVNFSLNFTKSGGYFTLNFFYDNNKFNQNPKRSFGEETFEHINGRKDGYSLFYMR
jgi:hypothetical protein